MTIFEDRLRQRLRRLVKSGDPSLGFTDAVLLRRRRQVRRRAAIVGIALVVVVALGITIAVGRHNDNSPTAKCTAQTATYDANGVRFTYPSCWTPVHYDNLTAFSQSLVYLSNQPTRQPCRTTTVPLCEWAVEHLESDGILIQWSANATPPGTSDPAPGTATTVGGRPAREDIETPGSCGVIGADETITINVTRTGAYNYFEMVACVRGPALPQSNAQIQQMVESTIFAYP